MTAGYIMYRTFQPVPQEPTKRKWYQPLHLLPGNVPKRRGAAGKRTRPPGHGKRELMGWDWVPSGEGSYVWERGLMGKLVRRKKSQRSLRHRHRTDAET